MLCVLWKTTGASEDAIGKTLNVAIKPAVSRCVEMTTNENMHVQVVYYKNITMLSLH